MKYFNKIKISCIILITGFSLQYAAAQTSKKLLLIGIDGCRPDALVAANTPVMDSLMATGTFSLEAQTIYPTVSGPCWGSMLTGVWHTKHGVTNNNFTGANFTQYPHFLRRLEQKDTTYFTASISQWAPINTYIIENANYMVNASTSIKVVDETVKLLTTLNPDAIFLQFDDVDYVGHAVGYGPGIPYYLTTIGKIDTYIGTILKAIKSRPGYANEDWLIIVSTDHGGINKSHGGNTAEEKKIFVIMSGGGFPHKEISAEVYKAEISPAIKLDTVIDYASAPFSSAYSFADSVNFTIECRVSSAGWNGDPALVSDKDWISGLNKGFVIAGNTDGATWKANIGDGTSRIDLNGGTINDSRFHHLALSVNRKGYAKIYQDGLLLDSTLATSIKNITSSLPVAIAQDGTLKYQSFFKGMIDEVRIWNTEVKQSTLISWACKPVAGSHPDFSHLIANWKFDENSGSTVSDFSNNNNSLSLANDSMWVTPAEPLQVKDYSTVPRIVDIAPTALQFFCIPADPSWALDGKSFLPLCSSTYSAKQVLKEEINVFPNPATAQICVQSAVGEISGIKIYSGMGMFITLPTHYNNRIAIVDISSLPAGVYFAEIKQGDYYEVKKFIKVIQ